MKTTPLVSIIVATYNSSKYVLETLNSAISQTYKNIEIIITDDCSTDNTVQICSQWIENNRSAGIPIKLVLSKKNTGVSGNGNRGFMSSHGEWIKFIAGDDILAPTAIDAYIKYVIANQHVKHLIACAIHFNGTLKDSDLKNPDKISQYMYRDKVTARDQYKVITKTFFGSGPTYFVHADTFRSVGCFDERFPMQEDYPLFIKIIGRGHKLMYLDHVTVYKRIVQSSIQYDRNPNDIFPKNKVRMIINWKYQYKYEALGPLWRMLLKYSLYIQQHIILFGNSNKIWKCRILYLIYKITDPFIWCDRNLALHNKVYLALCSNTQYNK